MKGMVLVLAVTVVFSNDFGQSSNSLQAGGPKMTLTGTIYDIHGSVIAQGRVTALRTDGTRYDVTTDEGGIYRFELPLAIYKLSATAQGFCPTTVERFQIVNSTYGKMSLDLVLQVGNSYPGCKHEITIRKKSQRRSRKTLKRIIE